MEDKGKGLINFAEKYSRIILFAFKILIVAPTLYLLKLIRYSGSWYDKETPVKFILTVTIIGILFIVILEIQHFIKRKKETYYCPKCKTTTQHNKFGICNTCHLDTASNNVFTAFCFLGIMIVVFRMIEYTYAPPELCYIILIGIAATFLYPIYMYPAKLARRTEHVAATAIFVLNLLFGFTIIFWVILLIWASNGNGGKKEVIIQKTPQNVTGGDAMEKINSLKQMLDSELISQDEFEEKKKDILSKM